MRLACGPTEIAGRAILECNLPVYLYISIYMLRTIMILINGNESKNKVHGFFSQPAKKLYYDKMVLLGLEDPKDADYCDVSLFSMTAFTARYYLSSDTMRIDARLLHKAKAESQEDETSTVD